MPSVTFCHFKAGVGHVKQRGPYIVVVEIHKAIKNKENYISRHSDFDAKYSKIMNPTYFRDLFQKSRVCPDWSVRGSKLIF